MTVRENSAIQFLKTTDWANAIRKPLAGDASNRRYERLHMATGRDTAVFMDAPPDKGENIEPFTKIARFLTGIGLSAPTIIAQDEANGFLVLEDLGDDLFARAMANNPKLELPLYECATDVLITLHQSPVPIGLAEYSPGLMAELAGLSFDWYLKAIQGGDDKKRAAFKNAFSSVLQSISPTTPVLIQRDYHAENLLWLPDRTGVARVGLLDFQDAMVGHPAYDLVSMMRDARRDVSDEIEDMMISRYVSKMNIDKSGFIAAYRILGVQRNLRILGVFTRLCIRDGKPGYIELLPRLWAYILADLSHPALSPVAEMVVGELPEPTPDVLQKIRERCP